MKLPSSREYADADPRVKRVNIVAQGKFSMSLSHLSLFWQKLFTKRTASKRSQIRSSRWGVQPESLEQKALLSAILDHGQDIAAADVAVTQDAAVARARQSNPYPIVNGTFILEGTNGTVVTGTVVLNQTNSESLTGSINIAGLPVTSLNVQRRGNRVQISAQPAGGEEVQVKGRFNRDHDEIKVRAVTRTPEGRVVTTATISFNSNTNPTTFTVRVNATNGVNATVVGTKQSILV